MFRTWHDPEFLPTVGLDTALYTQIEYVFLNEAQHCSNPVSFSLRGLHFNKTWFEGVGGGKEALRKVLLEQKLRISELLYYGTQQQVK